MKRRRFRLAALLAGALMAPFGTSAEVQGVLRPESSAVRLPVESGFPSLAGASGWLNLPPLTAAGLRGKVVLIDFWTYTCINWRRSLPYVRAWSEKYKDHGLVVIGVHSPEFEFEKDVGNVRRAVKDIGVGHPVAIDSDHAIWRAFMNQYWPARYFIDAQGRVRHHQFGEGEYEHGEAVIRQLLGEAGSMGPARPGTSVRFRVLIDGRPPGAAHGIDIDEYGNGTVTEQRLYLLIRQPGLVADRQFEIEFLDPGVESFRIHVRLS